MMARLSAKNARRCLPLIDLDPETSRGYAPLCKQIALRKYRA
jgi:hypothetical protein